MKHLKIFLVTPILMFLFLLGGCYSNFGSLNGIVGEGPMVERTVSMKKIKGLVIQNSADVYLEQGNHQKIRIEGQENILNNLITDPEGDVWKIRNRKPVRRAQKINIYITMEQLRNISISGSGDVRMDGHFSDLKDLDLRISGSGSINLDVEADDINGRVTGSGSLLISGSAKDLEFVITGSGGIKADDLRARNALARISGSGSISLWVSKRLDARISGSGNILYRGDPTVNRSVSGSGRVSSR